MAPHGSSDGRRSLPLLNPLTVSYFLSGKEISVKGRGGIGSSRRLFFSTKFRAPPLSASLSAGERGGYNALYGGGSESRSGNSLHIPYRYIPSRFATGLGGELGRCLASSTLSTPCILMVDEPFGGSVHVALGLGLASSARGGLPMRIRLTPSIPQLYCETFVGRSPAREITVEFREYSRIYSRIKLFVCWN
jgi:hypothetical protein